MTHRRSGFLQILALGLISLFLLVSGGFAVRSLKTDVSVRLVPGDSDSPGKYYVLLERRGDFSASGKTIRDPDTGQPFPGNIDKSSVPRGPKTAYSSVSIQHSFDEGDFSHPFGGDRMKDKARRRFLKQSIGLGAAGTALLARAASAAAYS